MILPTVCLSIYNKNQGPAPAGPYIQQLIKNNSFKVARVKIRYYNRTWESYMYQSAIKNVIIDAITKIKVVAKKAFLILHNYKVMTKNRAADFLKYLAKDSEYNMYNELLKMF